MPVLSVLKEERLFPASNQEEKNQEQKEINPEVVQSNSNSIKTKSKVKFKDKDDGLHIKAAATPKQKQTKLSSYFGNI